jgi:hypothetical protein
MRYMNDNPSEASFEMAHRVEWAAHNLERAADRVTNICEWIVYLVTGHYKEVQHETYGKGYLSLRTIDERRTTTDEAWPFVIRHLPSLRHWQRK